MTYNDGFGSKAVINYDKNSMFLLIISTAQHRHIHFGPRNSKVLLFSDAAKPADR